MEVEPVIKNTKTLQNRGSQTVSVVPSSALFIDALASPTSQSNMKNRTTI